MNIDQAHELREKGSVLSAAIMPNPSKTGGWFLNIIDTTCKSYLIVDDQDQVITVPTVDEMLCIVRKIGLRSVSVRLV